MAKVNYKGLSLREFEQFLEDNKHYTFCESLYAFLRLDKGHVQLVKDIKNISDETVYNLIHKARKEEEEY